MNDLLTSSGTLMPIDPDAELISVCAAFCDLERAYDAPGFAHESGTPEGDAAAKERKRIVAEQDVLVDRMCELPCTTLAGVQAMATALATWDRELLKDGPASDVGELITSNMVERLLALGRHDQHPDADLLALRPEFNRLHGLMIAYNTKDLIPDGGSECADFDALCRRTAKSAPAATAEGRSFQAAAALHDLTYRLSECEQGTYAAWVMLKGVAGNAYQSVEARA